MGNISYRAFRVVTCARQAITRISRQATTSIGAKRICTDSILVTMVVVSYAFIKILFEKRNNKQRKKKTNKKKLKTKCKTEKSQQNNPLNQLTENISATTPWPILIDWNQSINKFVSQPVSHSVDQQINQKLVNIYYHYYYHYHYYYYYLLLLLLLLLLVVKKKFHWQQC